MICSSKYGEIHLLIFFFLSFKILGVTKILANFVKKSKAYQIFKNKRYAIFTEEDSGSEIISDALLKKRKSVQMKNYYCSFAYSQIICENSVFFCGGYEETVLDKTFEFSLNNYSVIEKKNMNIPKAVAGIVIFFEKNNFCSWRI